MAKHRALFVLLLLPAALAPARPGRAEGPATVTVRMETCKVSGPPRLTGDTSLLRLLIAGPPTEELVKRGSVEVDGQKYTLYLPKAKAYSTKNTKPSDSGAENNSTPIYVEAKGYGRLEEEDGWFSNLPLRLGDRMFDVAEIAADGSRLVLRPSKAPLRGVIVGRKCPDFAFKTADGKEVSRDRLAGKPFLLDIWSIT